MSRPATKADLIMAANSNYEKLMGMINSMTDKELSTPFNFKNDTKKTEAHWMRDKNLRDVLAHLYEWHQLLLNWVNTNMNGGSAPFLLEPYNWKTYGNMNIAFWNRHQDTDLQLIQQNFSNSHKEVMKLLDRFSNEELFSKGIFPWVGGTTLGSYFVSTTSSHYDWAIKKLKAHKRIVYK